MLAWTLEEKAGVYERRHRYNINLYKLVLLYGEAILLGGGDKGEDGSGERGGR